MKSDKPKIHKITIGIGIVGVFIIIASTVRWFFLFPDYSQLIIALGIGVVFLGFAYIHETIKRIDEQIVEFDTALDALNIYYREEIDKLKKKVGLIKE